MAQFNYVYADLVLLIYRNIYLLILFSMIFLLNIDPTRFSIVPDVLRDPKKRTTGT